MGLFGLGWSDVVSGVATGVGFALGGPAGSALLGGAASTLAAHYIDGKSWGDSLETGLISGGLGMLGGGLVGGATSGLMKGGLKSLGTSLTKDLGLAFGKGSVGLGFRRELALMSMGHMGRGTAAAALSGVGGNKLSGFMHPAASGSGGANATPLPTKELPTPA
ncbi:hypothetical protein [Nocardia wallacei]|uniref:hypothetical protein n=1 Tax=Nocardia wallacei TaxID=480035 RepID=UPI002456ABE2|nr:hypothetical protein [Nocardia wallacei]